MNRNCIPYLITWLEKPDRKPLIIRGARQVGKTWLVRHLADIQKKALIELNFEENRSLASHFSSNDPHLILKSLSSALNRQIDPAHSLLFLDEIQAAPEVIAKLRWFAEKMAELPVIAAGSLLEFTFEKYSLSIPVGRIEYCYLEPLSFEEFLRALNKDILANHLLSFDWEEGTTEYLHDELMRYFKEYMIIGGMPAVVSSWVRKNSLQEVSALHEHLITTYQEDFPKYMSRINSSIYHDVLVAVPKNLAKKFTYSKVNPDLQTAPIKQAVDLLCLARVCHKVKATGAHGLPLAAEVKQSYNKIILIDVGLCSAALGLSLDRLSSLDEIDLVNKGGIAEQVTGQLLRTISPYYQNPTLYYWFNSDSTAEIDYIIQHRGSILPIEVKAGKTGTLKSLHLFMSQRQLSLALRVNGDLPHITEVSIKDHVHGTIKYQLRSIPFYLIGQIHRLLD